MKSLILALSLIVFVGNASAATWQVDTAKSILGFHGTQSGKPFEGHFTKFQASIDFDPANPASGHALVTIDMASAVTGDTQKDEALPQPEWFDVKTFPEARFEATSFRPKGGNAYEAVGRLTIRGISQDVVLPFTLDITNTQAEAKGQLPLIRTQFGVGQGPWSSGQWVALDVMVTLDLLAKKSIP